MPYDYTLTVIIPAAAREIYDAWLDSLAHSEMTGGRANMSAELGAEFSAWDGYITGRNLELVPGERIVQSWRTTKFPEDHEDSTITVTLEESDDGTLLTLWHSNVPEGHLGYEQGGWQKSYFAPMIAYFSGEPSAGGQAEEVSRSVPASEAPTEKRPEPRAAKQPVRRARLKRPAAKKTAAAPKGRPKRASAKMKAATPQARPNRAAAARKKLVAKGIAVASKAQRKSAVARATPKAAVAKAKKAVVKARAKPAIRAKARAKRAGSARRKSAGGAEEAEATETARTVLFSLAARTSANTSSLYGRFRRQRGRFSMARFTTAHDPGCVKTLEAVVSAQQRNRTCSLGESFMRARHSFRISLAPE